MYVLLRWTSVFTKAVLTNLKGGSFFTVLLLMFYVLLEKFCFKTLNHQAETLDCGQFEFISASASRRLGWFIWKESLLIAPVGHWHNMRVVEPLPGCDTTPLPSGFLVLADKGQCEWPCAPVFSPICSAGSLAPTRCLWPDPWPQPTPAPLLNWTKKWRFIGTSGKHSPGSCHVV